MTSTTTPVHIGMPSEQAFLQEALRALPLYIQHCECPDHWHALWVGLKATGMMRGLHGQADFLATMLRPHVVRSGHVMIAGAADTAALDVLHAALGDDGTRYTVVDRCQAPLLLLRQRALELGVELDTVHTGIEDARTEMPWTLAFIHYTLAFMDAASRQRLIRHLRQDIAADGAVVCAVREKQAQALDEPARQTATSVQTIEGKLSTTFTAHDALIAPLRQWLPGYVGGLQQREGQMVGFEQVMAEFQAGGFSILQSHCNPGQVLTHASYVSPRAGITNWVALLAPDPAWS